ncbi:MAG: c-type cytochrome, partial [Aestuariivirgaceae bacterium]
MSRSREFCAILLAGVIAAGPAMAGEFGLGRKATDKEIAGWNIDVRPDGQGLPAGTGSVARGEAVFADKCAACHGDFAEGIGRWPVLAGGQGSLTSDRPVRTVGSYWPYLSTLFDYIARAKPFGNAKSLKADEIYAITAFLLHMNDIVDADFELSRDNFTSVRLPNEANFIDDPRPDTPQMNERQP